MGYLRYGLSVEDESIEIDDLSEAFTKEIGLFQEYLDFSTFLNEAECKILKSNTEGEIILGYKRKPNWFDRLKSRWFLYKAARGKTTVEAINKQRDAYLIRSEKIEDRERDPALFKQALKKVQNYLEVNVDKLPAFHSLHTAEPCTFENEIDEFIINGLRYTLATDYYGFEASWGNKIRLVHHDKELNTTNLFIAPNSVITIEGKMYFVKMLTKAAQFKEDFEACYAFLDKAIALNKRILCESYYM